MKNTSVLVRVSEYEKAAWQEAAEAMGMSLSDFIRLAVNLKANEK